MVSLLTYDRDSLTFVTVVHRPPRLRRQGHFLRLQGQERQRARRHAQVVDPRLEARRFVQDARPSSERAREEADPEGVGRRDQDWL